MFNVIAQHLKEKRRPYAIIALMFLIIVGISAFSNTLEQNSLIAGIIADENQVAQASKNYAPLAPLPGQDVGGAANTVGYLQNLIYLGIGIAIVLAVLMIVIGGIRYMASDAFTEKKAATDQMTMAVWGLLIALGGYLLLETINPDLTTFRLPSGTGLKLYTKDPSYIEPQIQKIIEQIQRSSATNGAEITRFRVENDLGGMQDGGRLTTFPAGSEKYFEITEYSGNTSDLRRKVIIGATRECQRLGGEPKERFGTFICFNPQGISEDDESTFLNN